MYDKKFSLENFRACCQFNELKHSSVVLKSAAVAEMYKIKQKSKTSQMMVEIGTSIRYKK